MKLKTLCAAMGLCLSLAACAVGNTTDYRDVVSPLGVATQKTVAVEAVDKRPYVLADDNTPQWVGFVRDGFGTPFGVHTESGAPLATDLTQATISSLKSSGVKAVPAGARMAAERTLRITVKDWKSQSMFTTSVYFNAEAEVRDQAGTVLARNAINDKVVHDNQTMNLPSTKLELAKAAFRTFMDRLLDGRIREALR